MGFDSFSPAMALSSSLKASLVAVVHQLEATEASSVPSAAEAEAEACFRSEKIFAVEILEVVRAR